MYKNVISLIGKLGKFMIYDFLFMIYDLACHPHLN